MTNTRKGQVSLFIGRRYSGKTWYTTKKFIPAYTKAHPDRKLLVFDDLDHPDYRHLPRLSPKDFYRWKKGAYRMFHTDSEISEKLLKKLLLESWNTLLIVEDATKFLEGSIGKEIVKGILDSRNKGNDVILMFHSFQDVPPRILRKCDIYQMFATDNPQSRKNMISPYPEVDSTWMEIENEYDRSNNIYPTRTIFRF